ncbi:MAG: UvrB/UvrC motif-containing protein [bacterium]
MVCDICGIKEATIHFKQVINNQTTSIHLCEECAEEKGFGLSGISQPFPNLLEFFSNIFKEEKEAITEEMRCTGCGMGLSEFQKGGRLGCSDCFEAFKQPLLSLLKQIHGSTVHIGRHPFGFEEIAQKEKKLKMLKDELKKAISTENYEEAARLRDMIKALE